jgi:23S rRNA (cytidine1920-2'-O)/16S rRNA (cytidine1409-2'-O)-methyltransferase
MSGTAKQRPASPGRPAAGKSRLDQLLVERGLCESRTRAHALVMAGHVFSGEQRLDKPGALLSREAPLSLRGRDHPWVSRGGVKLAFALDHFALDPRGRTALDIGASTGGFTEVLLARAARRVFAVDVGRGQLAWKLRQDARVTVLERVNARFIDRALVPDIIEAIVCDASFIGLETLLPAPMALAAPGAWLVALIKPQFEVGPAAVGKGGVVRDEAAQRAACERISSWLAARPGWRVLGLVESPIQGADGNREFLIAGCRESD